MTGTREEFGGLFNKFLIVTEQSQKYSLSALKYLQTRIKGVQVPLESLIHFDKYIMSFWYTKLHMCVILYIGIKMYTKFDQTFSTIRPI